MVLISSFIITSRTANSNSHLMHTMSHCLAFSATMMQCPLTDSDKEATETVLQQQNYDITNFKTRENL